MPIEDAHALEVYKVGRLAGRNGRTTQDNGLPGSLSTAQRETMLRRQPTWHGMVPAT